MVHFTAAPFLSYSLPWLLYTGKTIPKGQTVYGFFSSLGVFLIIYQILLRNIYFVWNKYIEVHEKCIKSWVSV